MTEDISMKIVTMVTVVTVLLNAMAPTLAHAAIYLQGAEVNANTLVQDAYVQVTYYDRDDEQKLAKGWIDAVNENSFAIRSGALFGKKIIAYDKVVSVIMSDESTAPVKQMNEVNRFPGSKKREIERAKKEEEEARAKVEQAKREARMEQGKIEYAMRKLNQKTVTVISREHIDPSKITIGWYAHVVYISKEGATRTATGQIVNKDTTRIFVKDRMDRMTTSTIAYDDINTLVVAKQWSDIERYRESGAEYNARVRVQAPSILKRRMVGRLIAVKPDTLIIQRGSRFYQLPHSFISNLEVSIGQYRNTSTGMLIGAGLGLGTAIFVSANLTREKTPEDSIEKSLAEFFGAMGGLLIFFMATLYGATSKSDKWVEMSPQSLNLSFAPTSTKGLRAELTFNF